MATTKFGTLEVAELYVAGVKVGDVKSITVHPSPTVVPDSEATTIKALASDFNALLAALRAAGCIAPEN